MTTGTIEHRLPAELEQAVADRLAQAASEDVSRRLPACDATLWGPAGTPELADRLGWVTIAERLAPEAGALRAFREELQGEGFTDCLLLGMGGSSLAPEVFRQSYGEAGGLRLHVLDTTEPETIREFADRLTPATTLVLVSTKSGGTIETLSLFKHFWARFGEDGSRFAAVTDPGSGLEQLAADHGFRRTFLNDPEIGGRYSALSYFGLVPAALAGVDVAPHLNVADDGSGLWLGCALGELALRGRDKVSFVVDPPLESFGLWVEQLIAESTGKHGRGVLPIADEPMASPPTPYGSDRVFVHLAAEGASTPDFGEHPVITQRFEGPDDLGRIFYTWEIATAVAGWVLGINPFDQPNVQEAKDNTARALAEGVEVSPGDVSDLLDGLAAPAYVAIMGYLPYDPETDAAVLRLRAALLEKHGVATTFGYGPRFLHSTGQYHKGGPAQGRFLQLTHDSAEDEPVPGEAFGFRRLISAQADGDLATLRAHGLPAARATLPAGGIAQAVEELAERV